MPQGELEAAGGAPPPPRQVLEGTGAQGPTRCSRPPSPTLPEARLKAGKEADDGRPGEELAGPGRQPARPSPRRRGRERTGLPRPARLAELPAPRADRKSRPRGSGRGLIRILFAMQQLGGGLSLTDLAQ